MVAPASNGFAGHRVLISVHDNRVRCLHGHALFSKVAACRLFSACSQSRVSVCSSLKVATKPAAAVIFGLNESVLLVGFRASGQKRRVTSDCRSSSRRQEKDCDFLAARLHKQL